MGMHTHGALTFICSNIYHKTKLHFRLCNGAIAIFLRCAIDKCNTLTFMDEVVCAVWMAVLLVASTNLRGIVSLSTSPHCVGQFNEGRG